MKTRMKNKWFMALQVCCIFVILLVGSALNLQANTSQQDSNDDPGKASAIKIIVGESTIIKTTFPTVRVAVTDPKVADVKVLTPYEVLVQGTDIGSTDLLIWSEDGKEMVHHKVKTKLDSESYQQMLNDLFPHSSLKVIASDKALIVRGTLRSADEAAQLVDYLDKSELTYVNMTGIAGVQQVQLQVRVAEVSRQALRTLGVNAIYSGDDIFGAMTISQSSGTPLLSDISIGPGAASTSFSSAVTLLAGVPKWDLDIFLKALAENQYLKLLANPTLVAMSGEEASFLAGGEYPIPVVQGGGNNNSITIDYREYGIRLKFRPVVLGDNTIRLSVAPEVSELTEVGSVDIEGFSIPALLTRKMETTLELNSGQTLAMAGLIKNKRETVNSSIPGLGELPVLGPLFRSVKYQENETELVVLVTASLVEPMSLAKTPTLPGFLHKKPNDWELYIDGRLESKEPAKIHPDDAEWLRKNGIDRLLGPGAWDSYSETPSLSEADVSINSDTKDINTPSLNSNEKSEDISTAESTETANPIEG